MRYVHSTLTLLVLLMPVPVALAINPPATQEASTIDVVASGIGRTETDATKDALSNAVRQAIGAVLSAETLVKNDQIIRDQILTYSDGFVEKYELIGKPDTTSSGLVSVRIRAQVRRSTLVEKVRAANISVAEIDGESLFAEAVTKREQRVTAAQVIAKEFEGASRSLVKGEVVGKATYDEKKQKIGVAVRISVDPDAYDAMVKRLTDKLDDMHIPAFDVSTTQTPVEDDRAAEPVINSFQFAESQFPKVSGKRDREAEKDAGQLMVCLSYNTRGTSSHWRVYTIAPEVAKAVGPLLTPVIVSVELQDREQRVIDSKHRTIGENIGGGLAGSPLANGFYSAKPTTIVVWPMICTEGVGRGRPFGSGLSTGPRMVTWWVRGAKVADTMQLSFDAAPEDLKRVAKVVCRVETAEISNTGKRPGK